MLARQRQERILDEVERHGGARVSELVTTLGVSDMTIRRDIEELARRGLVLRVHGGATSITGRSADEPGFVVKSALHTGAEVGHRAWPPPSWSSRAPRSPSRPARRRTAWRSSCSTCPDLTVVTNSPPVADLLHESGRDDLTVILTGGVRTPSNALVGPVARRRPAHPARRHAVPRRARHRRAGRAHHAQPGRGRDRPGHGRLRPGGSSWSRTTASGAWSACPPSPTSPGRHPGHRRRHRPARRTATLATGRAARRRLADDLDVAE